MYIRLCLFLWLTTFSFVFWGLDHGDVVTQAREFLISQKWLDEAPTFLQVKIYLYVFFSQVMFLFYFIAFKLMGVNFSKIPYTLVGCGVLFTILTPSVLQTDQIRYVWDGIISGMGINPYKLAPPEHSFFSGFMGQSLLNHPELNTIYPPFSQFMFLVSTYLNPFLWGPYLGITWFENSFPSIAALNSYWKLEFGWKLLSSLFLLITLATLHKRRLRLDLFLLHPLVLFTWLANSHVDVIMIGALSIAFYLALPSLSRLRSKMGDLVPTARDSKLSMRYGASQALFLNSFFAAIFSKWLPLLYVPALLVWHSKNHSVSKKRRLSILQFSTKNFSILKTWLLYLLPWVFITYAYYQGSDGMMFNSSKAYAKDWYFFGFVHHFIKDILFVLQMAFAYFLDLVMYLRATFGIPYFDVSQLVDWSNDQSLKSHLAESLRSLGKYTSLTLMLFCQAAIFFSFLKGRLSIRLYGLISTFCLLAFFPTVHPWYLLILLLFWIPYQAVFKSPALWAGLILISKVFYAHEQEVYTARYLVYVTIAYSLFQDGKILKRHLAKRPRF